MAAIRAKDTRPERMIRSGLHQRGFRFRLHRKDLPGKPDIVLSKYDAVVFVHGCFWHGHDCHLYRLPKTRPGFWASKVAANQSRDETVRSALQSENWRIATIWECALKGKRKLDRDKLLISLTDWLKSTDPLFEIKGRQLDDSGSLSMHSPETTQTNPADR